jgi:Fur family zinc uptake transcriptional regulator
MNAAHHSNLHEHKQCISQAKSRFVGRLGEAGKTIGVNDEPVLHLLLSNHRAFNAYDIAETLSKTGKRIQPIQIYRSLEKLMALGVVHRLSTKNGFVACYKNSNCTAGQFLICTKCDSVKEIDNELLDDEIQNSAQKNNFSIVSKNVEVLGLCNNCV